MFNIIIAMCRIAYVAGDAYAGDAYAGDAYAGDAYGGIGYQGKLPWHIKADLQYFARLTKGANNKNAVVMGKNTWHSLPSGGLPGRDNFVLSSSAPAHAGHATTFRSIEDLIHFFEMFPKKYETIWIIGGAHTYQQFLRDYPHLLNKCYITYIDKIFECDTFLAPPSFTNVFDQMISSEETYDATNDCKVTYSIYSREKTNLTS
jgi:dihydrofolate reductase